MKTTSKVALCGVTAALQSAIMATSYFPYLTYAIPAFAGVLLLIPLVETGKKYAFFTYLASLLPVVFFAEIEAKLLYIVFLGYYPVLKAVVEKVKNRILEYGIKLVIFNAAVTAVYFAFGKVFGLEYEEIPFFGSYGVLILYVLANAAFCLYDILLTRLCSMYFVRLHPRISRIFKN